MNSPEVIHAIRYATETAKQYLMDEYGRKFPDLFQHASIETRPATNDDYFVPPSIANKCIVVVRTRFDEIGCRRMGCFPFKRTWEPCKEHDSLQWVAIGEGFELACQPSCQAHSIDTDWVNGRCVVANPYKKALASMPEKIFQRASRHVFHSGLNVKDGKLKFNKRYCQAYGLEFTGDDCVAPGGQLFGEWLFGRTIIRAAKTSNLKPYVPKFPPLPNYMNYTISKSRKRRSIDEPSNNQQLFKELALDLTKDLAVDITAYSVENYLKHKAPKLLTKAIDRISVKLVLKHAIASNLKQLGTMSLKTFGKGVGIASGMYAVYDVVAGILDVLDLYDYMKVLDKKTLEKIDKELDYTYFQDEPIRPELTPEYVWKYELLLDDESEKLAFMAEKVEEYLNALNQTTDEPDFKQSEKFIWKKKDNWNGTIFKTLMFVIICLTVLLVEWIHIWACCLFFILLHYTVT